jgi:uncharacterized membrane protein required for colicin V production
MTIYDAAMAIVVVAGMARGAWRGITWQLASIASLILGYTMARTMSAQVAPYMPGTPEAAQTLAMVVVYVAVSGGIFGIAWTVRGVLRRLKFEAYDRHLGMLLGGLEGLGVGILLTLFLVSLAPRTRQPIFSSASGRLLVTVMNQAGPVLPADVRRVLAPYWHLNAPEPESMADASTSAVQAHDDHGAQASCRRSKHLPGMTPWYGTPATRPSTP